MAITSIRPSTPVTKPPVTPEKPVANAPGSSTLPVETAYPTPVPVAAQSSGATLMTKFMRDMSISEFQQQQKELEKESDEFREEQQEEDARNGVE